MIVKTRSLVWPVTIMHYQQGWRSVRAFASHQCGPGSIPGLGVISGLSLLVLYSAPRGFSPGTPVFPSPLKPTLLKWFELIWFLENIVKRIWSHAHVNLRYRNIKHYYYYYYYYWWLDSSIGKSAAPVSQRSWVRIPFKPEFFSGLTFATA